MAEEFGANIASKVSDGEANVWHWEGVQKTINQLYQRDLYHQKMVKDEYTKAQAQLATQAAGLRAADIPDFQKAYGAFRTASLMLQDRRVSNNAEQRATYSKQRDDAFAEALSLAERSKEATKTKASYYNNWMQTGGLNASDDFHERMNQLDHLSVNEIRRTNYDNPMNFFNPKDDTPPPGELRKGILGNTKSVEDAEPMLDAKGQRMGSYITKYSVASEYPLGMVANNAISYLKHKQLTKSVVDEFNSLPPEQAKASIDAANQLVQKETPNAPPLPYDYTGYYAAKWVNQARVKTLEADKAPKYDELYFKQGDRAQQWAIHADSEKNQNMRQDKTIANQRAMQADRDKKVAASYQAQDLTPVYYSLQKGDREQSVQALTALAANNPEKPQAVVISRLDIFDPQKRKALFESFGINPNFKYKNSDDQKTQRDEYVKAVVNEINKVSGGDKIDWRDLSYGKIVGAFIHTGTVNEFKDDRTYMGTKQTRLPIIVNPQRGSAAEFSSKISNQTTRKDKNDMLQQNADLNGIYPGIAPPPSTDKPKTKNTAKAHGI